MEESRNPEGPSYFERLRAVADLRYDDSVEEAAYQTVMEKIAECEELVAQYEQTNGFRSQTVRVGAGLPLRPRAHPGRLRPSARRGRAGAPDHAPGA